jgi:hypothetical protein
MNASDIVKSKQNATLYKAYYNPTVFQSSIISTIYPISSFSTNVGTYVSSFTSCINTVYTYTCNNPIISYELANDINSGKYECGGKKVSELIWKANTNVPTTPVYAFQSYSTTTTGASTILSVNSYAVRPLICASPQFTQGTNFASKCEVCNNNTLGTCCYSCGGN